MTKTQHILAGVITALALLVGLEFLPYGGQIFMVLGVMLLLLTLVFGPRLPLMFRILTCAFIFYWAYIACLVGRTMQPGLSGYTANMAFTFFVIFGWWPGIALFRLWRPRVAVVILCALLPVAFTLAATVAGTEEYLFVCKYRDTGVGVTERWPVSNHWLSYDKAAHRLDGSD